MGHRAVQRDPVGETTRFDPALQDPFEIPRPDQVEVGLGQFFRHQFERFEQFPHTLALDETADADDTLLAVLPGLARRSRREQLGIDPVGNHADLLLGCRTESQLAQTFAVGHHGCRVTPDAMDRGRQKPVEHAEPFRVTGNVGALQRNEIRNLLADQPGVHAGRDGHHRQTAIEALLPQELPQEAVAGHDVGQQFAVRLVVDVGAVLPDGQVVDRRVPRELVAADPLAGGRGGDDDDLEIGLVLEGANQLRRGVSRSAAERREFVVQDEYAHGAQARQTVPPKYDVRRPRLQFGL